MRYRLSQAEPLGSAGTTGWLLRLGPPHTAAARAPSRTAPLSCIWLTATRPSTTRPITISTKTGAIRQNSTRVTPDSDRRRAMGDRRWMLKGLVDRGVDGVRRCAEPMLRHAPAGARRRGGFATLP